MRLITYLIFTIFLLNGCGPASRNKLNSDALLIGTELQKNRTMTDKEYKFASAVCESLKLAKLNFPRDFSGLDFTFKMKDQPCESSRASEYEAKAMLTPQLAFIVYDNKKIFEDLPSSESTVFKILCETLELGREPNINEIVDMNTTRQFEFSSQNDSAQIIASVKTASKQSSTNYLVTQIETFIVQTKNIGNPSINGMTIRRTLTKGCETKSTTPTSSIFESDFVKSTIPQK